MGRENTHPWYASPNQFLKCPVEGCEHIGTIITKAHLRMAHDMTRDQAEETYGLPTTIGKARWIKYD